MKRSGTQFTRLLECARAGDRSALGRLLESFRSYLLLFAEAKLGADLRRKCSESDLVQQTFLEAQQAFGRFEAADSDELLAWLERILLNNLGDAARIFRRAEKRQIKREVPLVEGRGATDELMDLSTPSKKVSAQEEADQLRRALALLPEDYRRVIVLRNLQRHDFEDIAEEMGRSAGAVKKLWSRAILQLKREIR